MSCVEKKRPIRCGNSEATMVVFDIDPTAAAATRNQLFSRLAREDVWVAEPHTSSFPGLGRLHKEGRGYSWAPVVFTDQWDER